MARLSAKILLFPNICAFSSPIACILGHFCNSFFWFHFLCLNTRTNLPLLILLLNHSSIISSYFSSFKTYCEILLSIPNPNFSILAKSPLSLSRQQSKKLFVDLNFFSPHFHLRGCWQFQHSILLPTLNLYFLVSLFHPFFLDFFLFFSLSSTESAVTVPKLNAKKRQNVTVKWICGSF